MSARSFFTLGLGLVVACSDSGGPNQTSNERGGGNTQGAASVSGVIYGFTAAPDSQRFEVAGATVVLVRVGDLAPPDTGGVDTLLPPPDPDTSLTNRPVVILLGDTVVPPDTTAPPPPDPGCGPGTTAATVVTGNDGAWQADGLEEGIYLVEVAPPAGSQLRGIEYCGYEIRNGQENQLTLYLPLGPGPDPLPGLRRSATPF
jgi:hypothetical protein